MCGIVGASGKTDIRKFIIDGLSDLDYRGYDSAGLAFTTQVDENINIFKTVGRVIDLDRIVPNKIEAVAGIGHTRWATHGVPSTQNSHPHTSMRGNFSIVHNGVIENYRALKTRLTNYGYTFKSETDTEVIANMLEHNYRKFKDVILAIESTMEILQGSYAIAILFKQEKDRIYFMKNHSPLLLGESDGVNYLASDAVPMAKYTNKFIDLNDKDYGYISPNQIKIYALGKEIAYKYSEKSIDSIKRDLKGYEHFMLKEIEETPRIINGLVDNYFDGKKFLFETKMLNAIRSSDEIVFIACGTSYYASLCGVRDFLQMNKKSTAYIASEWAYNPQFNSRRPFYILVSQSGETADLIHCQKILNDRGSVNLVVTNTKGSTLERNATFSLLLYAGLEVAVASTKAYSAQASLFALLTSAIDRKVNIVSQLYTLNDILTSIIARKEEIHDIAIKIKDAHDIFFLGRGSDYDGALEGSLKLKEITYIHSEAVPGGELKHGPIALIEKGTPVIGFISNPVTDLPMRGNFKEVEARGAIVFCVASTSLAKEGDSFVIPDSETSLSVITKVFFAQYLAYFVAKEKGVNIDKPRNLAKSVTVE